MKNTILFLYMLFCSTLLCSQEVVVSKDLNIYDNSDLFILGQVEEDIVILKDKTVNQKLMIFDKKLFFKQEIELELEDKHISTIGINNDSKSITYYYRHRDKDKEYLKSAKMNARGMVFYKDTIATFDHNAFANKAYRFAKSNNDRYTCIFFIESGFHVLLYDNQEMQLVNNFLINPEEINLKKDFRKLTINNTGVVSILFENNKTFRTDHYMHVYNLFKNGSTETRSINLQKISPYNIKLIPSEQAPFYKLVGLYGDNKKNTSEGIFTVKQDSIFLIPYSKSVMEKFNSTKQKSKRLKNLDLIDVIERVDGGVICVLESRKRVIYDHSNNGVVRTFRSDMIEYFFDDILVIALHPNLKEHWNLLLPKKQFSQDDDAMFSSFFNFKTDKYLKLVFNDEIGYNNTVSEYIINPSGISERRTLLNTNNQNLRLIMSDAVQLSGDSFLVASETRSKLNLVRINF